MAERLVVLSDLWGSKKGLWITSYLGYLQQYYDIVYYDCQQLAGIDVIVHTAENLKNAFADGGLDTAVAHILKKETNPSHYLTFGAGGTIAWNAALKGLPVKSLYAVSSLQLHLEKTKPELPISLLYGENDQNKPSKDWSVYLDVPMEIVPNFGHGLYTDEKIIKKICMELLETLLKKQFQY